MKRGERTKLKRLRDQTIVITGASSGIGLATARQAGRAGARLVLVSRNAEELSDLVRALNGWGVPAIAVPGDVADAAAVDRVADEAIARFGGFDTWINNAGVSVYGRTLDVPVEDERRLFETNYWGMVNGSRTAARHLRTRGGAIVNVGSIVSDRAVPLQAAYSASKHALKAFTDTLRMELEQEGAPVSVTLVKPAAIDTPFFEHAANYMDRQPSPPPPVYSADEVARTILRCAEKRVRDITVGGGGRLMVAAAALSPRLGDLYMEKMFFEMQKSTRPEHEREKSLRTSRDGGSKEGRYEGPVLRRSAYTRAMLSDLGRALPLMAIGAVCAIAWQRLRSEGPPRPATRPSITREPDTVHAGT